MKKTKVGYAIEFALLFGLFTKPEKVERYQDAEHVTELDINSFDNSEYARKLSWRAQVFGDGKLLDSRSVMYANVVTGEVHIAHMENVRGEDMDVEVVHYDDLQFYDPRLALWHTREGMFQYGA